MFNLIPEISKVISMGSSTDSTAPSTPYSITDDRTIFYDQNGVNNYFQWPPGQPVLVSSFEPYYTVDEDLQSTWLSRSTTKASQSTTQSAFSRTNTETLHESNAIGTGDMLPVDVLPEQFERQDVGVLSFDPRQVDNDRRTSDIMLPRLERTKSTTSFNHSENPFQNTYHISGRRQDIHRKPSTLTSSPEEDILDQQSEYHAYWKADSPLEPPPQSNSRRSSALSSTSTSDTPPEDLRSPTLADTDLNELASLRCTNCETRTTPLWRRDIEGAPLCNACGLYLRLHGRRRPLSLKTDVIKRRNRSSRGKEKVVGSERERERERDDEVSRRRSVRRSNGGCFE